MFKKSKSIPVVSQGQMRGSFQGIPESKVDSWGVQQQSQEMGFLDIDLSDIGKSIEKSVNDFANNTASKVDSYAKENLPDELLNAKAQIDSQIQSGINKFQDDVKSQASDYASSLVTKQANDPSNQNNAIMAMTNKVGTSVIEFKEAIRTTGLSGAFKSHPIPFYVLGGLATLATVKWGLAQVGKGQVKGLKTKSNPRKRKVVKRKTAKRKSKK